MSKPQEDRNTTVGMRVLLATVTGTAAGVARAVAAWLITLFTEGR